MNLPKIITALTVSLFTMSLISSCKKEDKDTENPVITVIEPEANDTVSDEVHVEVMASDNKALKEISFKITNSAGAEVYSQSQAIPGLSAFTFHEHYDVSGIPVITAMNVIISAKDNSDNTASVTVPLVVKP